jgi:hypothetical protein
MKLASPLSRNTTAAATSSASPNRPSGWRARNAASRADRASAPSAAAKVASSIGVSIEPGQTQLMRMPYCASDRAALRVSITTAPLLAE